MASTQAHVPAWACRPACLRLGLVTAEDSCLRRGRCGNLVKIHYSAVTLSVPPDPGPAHTVRPEAGPQGSGDRVSNARQQQEMSQQRPLPGSRPCKDASCPPAAHCCGSPSDCSLAWALRGSQAPSCRWPQEHHPPHLHKDSLYPALLNYHPAPGCLPPRRSGGHIP